MTKGFIFWLLMLLWLIFGVFTTWPERADGWRSYTPFGGSILMFILLFLLGWQVFGFIIKDSDTKG